MQYPNTFFNNLYYKKEAEKTQGLLNQEIDYIINTAILKYSIHVSNFAYELKLSIIEQISTWYDNIEDHLKNPFFLQQYRITIERNLVEFTNQFQSFPSYMEFITNVVNQSKILMSKVVQQIPSEIVQVPSIFKNFYNGQLLTSPMPKLTALEQQITLTINDSKETNNISQQSQLNLLEQQNQIQANSYSIDQASKNCQKCKKGSALQAKTKTTMGQQKQKNKDLRKKSKVDGQKKIQNQKSLNLQNLGQQEKFKYNQSQTQVQSQQELINQQSSIQNNANSVGYYKNKINSHYIQLSYHLISRFGNFVR